MVTAADKTKEYGNLTLLLTFAYSGFQGTDTATDLETAPTCSTTATQFSGVAGSPYPITCAGGVDDNYSFTYVPAQLTITKAPLTVTAADKTKEYGNLNPLLTFAYSGFQGTDTATDLETAPTCSTTATQFSGVAGSPYPITCAGGVDDNYSFTYVPAQLTITRAPLTVTAADKTKEYGNLNPLLTFAYSGFQGTDTATDLETAPTCSTTATQFSGVAGSPYPITCAGAGSTTTTRSPTSPPS